VTYNLLCTYMATLLDDRHVTSHMYMQAADDTGFFDCDNLEEICEVALRQTVKDVVLSIGSLHRRDAWFTIPVKCFIDVQHFKRTVC
jgi:hypothetical protein